MTLASVLERGRERGYIGPGPIEPHLAHAAAMGAAVESVGALPARALDLGSGSGVPGLVLAQRWADSTWVLLESRAGRAAFLREAVTDLGMDHRVIVVHARAEEGGRDPLLRSSVDLVTSRSFGPPAVTAECASPFLRTGGHLIVSEPPGGDVSRWPAAGIRLLGLEAEALGPTGVALQLLRQASPCPPRYPRRPGVPSHRPLF